MALLRPSLIDQTPNGTAVANESEVRLQVRCVVSLGKVWLEKALVLDDVASIDSDDQVAKRESIYLVIKYLIRF